MEYIYIYIYDETGICGHITALDRVGEYGDILDPYLLIMSICHDLILKV